MTDTAWERQKLSDACEFITGLWKGEKPPFVNVGVFRNTNFTAEGTLDDSDVAYLDVEAKKFEKRRLIYGDVILEKSGGGPKQPVGRVALFDKEGGEYSFSNFTAAMRVKDPHKLDFRFLHKFLFWTYVSGVTERMQSHAIGIRNLDGDAYKNIEVPVPPLAEQRRTVAVLDEAFGALATAKTNAERSLDLARSLFQSQMEHVFASKKHEWVRKPLGELCDVKHGFAFKGEFFGATGEYVLLTPGNFFESGGYRDRGAKQKYYTGDVPDGYVLSKGDLLVAMTEQAPGLLGSPILIPDSGKFLHNQRLGLVIAKPSVPWTNEFFFHVFNTKALRKELHATSSGVKVRHTSPTKIRQVVVSFPASTREQHEIVAALQEFRDEALRLESAYQRKLAALDELKVAVLRKAFTSEV